MRRRTVKRPAFAAWSVPRRVVFKPGYAEIYMREWQGGRCAMCGCRDDQLVLDHDHDTWKIRGYLCYRCNQDEGKAFVDPHWDPWRAGHAPAGVLGIDVDYYKPREYRYIPTREDQMRLVEVMNEIFKDIGR